MGWYYIRLIDISSGQKMGYVLMSSTTGKILRPFYNDQLDKEVLNSVFSEHEEFALLFGINRVEKFLPEDYQIEINRYDQFKQFIDTYIQQKYHTRISFVDWTPDTVEFLSELHTKAIEHRAKGKPYQKFESWLEDSFEEKYRNWLDAGNPSLLTNFHEGFFF